MEELWPLLGYPRVKVYGDLNLSETSIDLNTAFVIANTTLDSGVGVYSVRDDCVGCPYKLQEVLNQHQSTSFTVKTDVPFTWMLMNRHDTTELARGDRSGLLCRLRPSLGEYGIYNLDVGKCSVKEVVEPINIYLPLLFCFLIFIVGYMFASLVKFILKRRQRHNSTKDTRDDLGKIEEAPVAVTEKKKSLPALYVFRGLILSFIIFVTTGGGGYSALTRNWGGFTLADCLFYAYVWSIGAKIPRSIDGLVAKGHSKCRIFSSITKRSFTLIFIGTLIDSAIEYQPSQFSKVIWCPLQRLGVAYFITSLAYGLTVKKFKLESKLKPPKLKPTILLRNFAGMDTQQLRSDASSVKLSDIQNMPRVDDKMVISKVIENVVSLLWCWLMTVFLIAIQCICIVAFISFNCQSNLGIEYPYNDPSVITEVSNSCTRHITTTRYINYIFMALPEPILYINSYFLFTRGLLGTLSTVIQCMIGLKAGAVYWHHDSHGERLKLWSIWTLVFAIGAIIFAGLSIPFQLNLWPISSIILLSTISMAVFSVIYIIEESTKIVEMNVLRSAGITFLATFCGHILFSSSVPFHFNLHMSCHFEYLMQCFWILALWLIIGYILMRKNLRFFI